VVEQVEAALGPVTLLVNNAGTAQEPGPLWEADPGDWWRDLEVHVRGAFNCCRGWSSGDAVAWSTSAAWPAPATSRT
jgi:NAD(P)-dependent dehydrogenase (short-subunit alcohol dehydrogenase family)